MILAPPGLWSGQRPTRSAACSRPPRAETPPLPATYCWPGSLLRSQPGQPSHGRGNASSRPFGNGRWGRGVPSTYPFKKSLCIARCLHRKVVDKSDTVEPNRNKQAGWSISFVKNFEIRIAPEFEIVDLP